MPATKPQAVPASLLSPTQRQNVDKLIRLHHYALVIELLGDKSVPKAVLTQVKTAGLYRKPRLDVLKRSYQFGKSAVIDEKVLTMTPVQFERYVERKGDVLSSADAMTVRAIREGFAQHLDSLAEAYSQQVAGVVEKANKTVRDMLADKSRAHLFAEVARRKALSQIAKDMRDATVKIAGNASRTISTETNNAYQNGRALEILRKSGEDDPHVFKQPRHDACEECKAAYLDGHRPKVFKLSELMANGTNIGKAHAERLPVLEAYHPWCACEVFWMPPGFDFDQTGKMIFVGKVGVQP